MSESEIERAADMLEERLRGRPWFISLGVGRNEDGDAIFIYSRNLSGPKRFRLASDWMGFPVVVRPVGGINGGIRAGDADALALFKKHGATLVCLGQTRNGQPKHPLYMPASAPLVPFEE